MEKEGYTHVFFGQDRTETFFRSPEEVATFLFTRAETAELPSDRLTYVRLAAKYLTEAGATIEDIGYDFDRVFGIINEGYNYPFDAPEAAAYDMGVTDVLSSVPQREPHE
jgi:hypothetical protein